MPLSLLWDEGDLDLKKVRDTLQGEWPDFRRRIEAGEALLWNAYGQWAKVPNAVLLDALRELGYLEALVKRGRLTAVPPGAAVILWRQATPR